MNNQEPQSRVKRYDFNQGTSNQSRRPQQFKVWPWIVLLIVIIIVLVGGIKWFDGHSNAKPNQNTTSQQVKNSSSHQSSSKHSASSNSANTASHHSSSHKNRSQSGNPNPDPNQPTSNGKNVFAGDHQFGSVQDAQSWAQATQNSWLQEGYTNYTINSDGQGYYILRFTK